MYQIEVMTSNFDWINLAVNAGTPVLIAIIAFSINVALFRKNKKDTIEARRIKYSDIIFQLIREITESKNNNDEPAFLIKVQQLIIFLDDSDPSSKPMTKTLERSGALDNEAFNKRLSDDLSKIRGNIDG